MQPCGYDKPMKLKKAGYVIKVTNLGPDCGADCIEVYGRHVEKHAKNTTNPSPMTSDEEMPSEHERTHPNHCIFFFHPPND